MTVLLVEFQKLSQRPQGQVQPTPGGFGPDPEEESVTLEDETESGIRWPVIVELDLWIILGEIMDEGFPLKKTL